MISKMFTNMGSREDPGSTRAPSNRWKTMHVTWRFHDLQPWHLKILKATRLWKVGVQHSPAISSQIQPWCVTIPSPVAVTLFFVHNFGESMWHFSSQGNCHSWLTSIEKCVWKILGTYFLMALWPFSSSMVVFKQLLKAGVLNSTSRRKVSSCSAGDLCELLEASRRPSSHCTGSGRNYKIAPRSNREVLDGTLATVLNPMIRPSNAAPKEQSRCFILLGGYDCLSNLPKDHANVNPFAPKQTNVKKPSANLTENDH